MSHGITTRDGVFAVREPMWHGLGEVLEDYPTREEAQAIAHPWEPITEPLYRKVPTVDDHGNLDENYEEVPERGVSRSDDGFYLGAISPTRGVVKNAVMYDIAEALEGAAKGSVLYETGGSLFGGKKVWLLLRLRDPIKVAGDPHGLVIPYFAMQNGLVAGEGAFRGQATMCKIVCDNTSQMADLDSEARGTEFLFRNTSKVNDRIEEAKAALSGWRESIETFQRLTGHLQSLRIDEAQAAEFAEVFIPMPAAHTVSKRVEHNVEEARKQLLGILAGPTCEGTSNTAWGLVSASVEYLNHHRKAKTAETRFKRSYLDRDRLVSDAVQIALEVAR